MTDFSQKLSVLRRMLGKGQKTIAADVGVTQETISKWELGTIKIPEKRLSALARSLECSPTDFKELSLRDLVTIVANGSLRI